MPCYLFNDAFRWLLLVLLSSQLFACVVVTADTPVARASSPRASSALPVKPPPVVDESLASEISQLKTTRQVRDKILRLHHQDPVERAWAAYQLAKLGRGAVLATPYLIKMLADDTPVLLSRYLGGGFHSSSDTTPAQEASRTLAKIGDPATGRLIKALNSENEKVRRLAVKSLGQIGDFKSIDVLIGVLSDPSRRVRATAAIALGNYNHPIASQKLTEAFPAVAPEIRVHLVYALSQINDIIAVPFLIDQFNQQDPDVKAAIALALGKLRDARALPVLLKAVNDNDEIVRANAAYALSSFYSPVVMDTLINSLDDPVQRVQEAAAEALNQLTGLKLGPGKQKWLSWWQTQKQAMTKDNKQKGTKSR